MIIALHYLKKELPEENITLNPRTSMQLPSIPFPINLEMNKCTFIYYEVKPTRINFTILLLNYVIVK
jgi:hypothetical protein